MIKSSSTFTSLVSDAPGVDPKLLELPLLSSSEAFVAAVNEVFPDPLSCVDDFDMCPDLVSDDGSSQSSDTLLCSPQTYDYPPLPYGDIYYVPPYSPTTAFTSSPSPPAARRVLAEAQCAGGKPIKQKGGGYSCSTCDKPFKRRDDAKRHIDTAGIQIECKYCRKPASGRRDARVRHLVKNQKCWKAWDAGYKAGRFTTRSLEDAFN